MLVNFERRKSSLLDQNLAIVSLPDTAEILSFLTSDIPKIEEEILQLEKVALHASALDRRRARLGDLKDRCKLGNALDITLQRLSDLNLLTGVKKCIAQTNTRATSLQLSILRKDLITDELERRIQAEITALDLSHLPLQTKEVSSAGESLFSVGLKTASSFKNNQILSEGEQRALALACFLSEMGSDGSSYGLIVDDPVSSLDHNRVRKVAQRLIAEAEKGRQVIIFTHNIVFFNEIVSEASRSTNKIPLVKSVISKSATEGFGIIKEDCEPWIADVNERIKNLRDRAKSYRSETNFSDERYRRLVKDFYSDLRETWERLVEEVVLAKTVVRFVPDVMTQRLREVCITDNDYRIIYFAMKRASERSGHDMAAGRNITAPTPAEIETDLKELDEFRIEYKKRSKMTSTARSALENAAKAEFI
ncbi:hypothetical protein GCM10007887_06590 [Methylobacterium haplocladii]|uniref:Protein CR006 P-loop domain-containing protein n=2 Tax=Methylobacterium haplocladii TaxID=1176176 RepID=A0A512IQ72_9HYPH|nr:hypothetical protein MHA02_22270 [Methylobacterium haplocladii]GLS58003.1 hypothetical protein GCM10007887_06590 [Methylobacterium haplocladii]